MSRFVAQSFATMRHVREGGMVKTENDPLDPTPPPAMRESHAAMRHLEEAVTDAGGVVLRYGVFYGADNDGLIEPVRKRQFPIVGDGGGVSSWVHLDDAAAGPCWLWNTTWPASTTSSTTSPPRHASGCRCSRKPSAPSRPATSPLARAAVRRRDRGDDGNRVSRRLEREGQA